MRIRCSESTAPKGPDAESALRTVRRIAGERLAEVVLERLAHQQQHLASAPIDN